MPYIIQESGEVPQFDYSPKSTVFRPTETTWLYAKLYDDLDIDAQILVIIEKDKCNIQDLFMIKKTNDILVRVPKP